MFDTLEIKSTLSVSNGLPISGDFHPASLLRPKQEQCKQTLHLAELGFFFIKKKRETNGTVVSRLRTQKVTLVVKLPYNRIEEIGHSCVMNTMTVQHY